MRTRFFASNRQGGGQGPRRASMLHRLGSLAASLGLLASLSVAFSGVASADAGNPILGTIHATSEFNPDGTVTVYVRGQWNWYSHNSDCNFDRAGTGVGIIWNDPTETGFTVAKGAISAQIGVASKNGSWNDPNAIDRMVHPVDVGHVPAGYPGAAGQQFNDPASNNPGDFASWKGGCGREPISATANPNGPTCGDGSQACADHPWGSWGYSKNGGKGYSHVFRSLADISRVCANFYDVHGGGKAGSNSFQAVNGAKEITVDQANDNSIDTNSFNVNEGANCITVAPPDLVVKKVVDKAQADPGDSLTYTITVQNLVNVDIPNIDVTDDISAVVPGHGTLTGSTPAAAVANGNQLSWLNQTIPASTTRTYQYVVKLADSGWPNGQTQLPNTVVVTKSNCVAGSNDPNCSTITIVQPKPDLTVTKTADNVSVPAGSQIGFTITATNTGATTLTNVQLTDPLPTIAGLGITWSVASSSPANACQVAGLNLTCSFGSLAAGASASVHVTSPTTAPAGGGAGQVPACTINVKNHTANLDNTATVTSGAISKTDEDGICVTNPGLNLVKTADNVSVPAGNQVGFTITATNSGNTTLSNVTLSDPLPTIAGLGMAWSVASSTPANACQVNGTQLSCNFGSLASGASASVHVISPTTAPAAGGANPLPNCQIQIKGHSANLDNTATVTSGNTSKTDRDGICVTNPGLTLVKTADNVSVAAGNQIGFTITATNSGNTTLTNVTLSDPLPTIAGLGIAWSVASSSPANACAINGNGGLSCTFGDLAPGASASVHVTSPTTAPAAGGANPLPNCLIQIKGHTANLDNTATVTTGNTSITDRDGVCITNPGLDVVKTADNASVVAGNQIGFTITARNSGNTTLSAVSLNDPLPTVPNAGIAWSVASSSPANACQIAANTLTCAFGDLAPGASASVHVTSPTTAPAPGAPNQLPDCTIQVKGHNANLDNTATVSSGAFIRTDRDGICLTSTPHISVTKTPDAPNVLAGNPVGFTITVKSDGSGTAKAVAFTDALPTLAGLGINWSINPAFSGPGSCSIQGAAPAQNLVCAFGDLASGTQASVHVTSNTVAPAPGGGAIAPCQISVVTYATNLDNRVTVTSSTASSATAQTGICLSINPNPAIHVVKTANPTTLPVGGGPVTYTYAVTNVGNVPLSNVTAVDDKCSPLVFLNGDTNGDARLDLTETWHYSCTQTITVTTTNTVVATGHYTDPNDPAHRDQTVTDQDQATVIVPVPTPTPTGSVQGATSPPKPIVTLPPTDASGPLGSTDGPTGLLMVLIVLAGITAAVPVLAFGKRGQVRR